MSAWNHILEAASKLDKSVKEAEAKIKTASCQTSVFDYESWKQLTSLRKESEVLVLKAQVNSKCFSENLANLREFVTVWKKLNSSIGECIQSLTQDAIIQGWVPPSKCTTLADQGSVFPETFSPDHVMQLPENDKENIPSQQKLTAQVLPLKPPARVSKDTSQKQVPKKQPSQQASKLSNTDHKEVAKGMSLLQQVKQLPKDSPTLPSPLRTDHQQQVEATAPSPEAPEIKHLITSPAAIKTPVLPQLPGFFSDLTQVRYLYR